MRRGLEAVETRLYVGQCLFNAPLRFFERAHTTVQLRVRELDHGLCLREAATHFPADVGGFAREQFSRVRETLRDELHVVTEAFRRGLKEVAVLGGDPRRCVGRELGRVSACAFALSYRSASNIAFSSSSVIGWILHPGIDGGGTPVFLCACASATKKATLAGRLRLSDE